MSTYSTYLKNLLKRLALQAALQRPSGGPGAFKSKAPCARSSGEQSVLVDLSGAVRGEPRVCPATAGQWMPEQPAEEREMKVNPQESAERWLQHAIQGVYVTAREALDECPGREREALRRRTAHYLSEALGKLDIKCVLAEDPSGPVIPVDDAGLVVLALRGLRPADAESTYRPASDRIEDAIRAIATIAQRER